MNTETDQKKEKTANKRSYGGIILLIAGVVLMAAAITTDIVMIKLGIIKDIHVSLIISALSLSVILITLSVAQIRIDKGKAKNKKLIKALTPAQICLIISSVFFAASFWFFDDTTEDNSSANGFSALLLGLHALTFNAAWILAIVKYAKNKTRKAYESGNSAVTGTPIRHYDYIQTPEQTTAPLNRQYFVCTLCRKNLPVSCLYKPDVCKECISRIGWFNAAYPANLSAGGNAADGGRDENISSPDKKLSGNLSVVGSHKTDNGRDRSVIIEFENVNNAGDIDSLFQAFFSSGFSASWYIVTEEHDHCYSTDPSHPTDSYTVFMELIGKFGYDNTERIDAGLIKNDVLVFLTMNKNRMSLTCRNDDDTDKVAEDIDKVIGLIAKSGRQ